MNNAMNQHLETHHIDGADTFSWKPKESETGPVSLVFEKPPGIDKPSEQERVELAPEVEKALDGFITRWRREFTAESFDRAQAEHISVSEAYKITEQNARKRIAEYLQKSIPTLSESESKKLEQNLRHLDDRGRDIAKAATTVGKHTVTDATALTALSEEYLNKKYILHKKLYPEDPENIIEAALLDAAVIDPDTRMITSLFPFSNKAKHEKYTAQAERAAKASAEAAARDHLSLDAGDPPTLGGQTPTKKPSLWQRLLGRN